MKKKTKMKASTWVTNELATDTESNKIIQNQSFLPITHQEHTHSDPGRDTGTDFSENMWEKTYIPHI